MSETSDLDYRKLNPAIVREVEPVEQGRSLVVVIGVNEYVYWQKLKNAVQDAIGLQQTLIDKLGFSAPIPPLINEAATKLAITSLIEDQLREELQEDDNLVLFFAGHGHTRVDKVGGKVVGETGFIVPVEGRGPKEVWSDYIEIDPLLKSISRLPARHILVILDSCHSGFALGEAMKIYKSGTRYEKDLSSRISRKVITSARRDQLALDGGPIPGHSLFTGTLVDGFNWGKADLDGNGLITSSELGLFIQQQVGQASQSRQTPDFGSFHLDDRGEMVISLRNQSFDALKARAFSALQSGKLTTFKDISEQLILLSPSRAESLYLEYRLRLFEHNLEKAIKIIEELGEQLDQGLVDGIIPLSRSEIWELRAMLPEWAPLLKIPNIDFPLDVTFYTSEDRENFEIIEEQDIGETKGFYIPYRSRMRFVIENNTQAPMFASLIVIDSNGCFQPLNIWKEPFLIYEGLSPGQTAISASFIQDEVDCLSELRLFSSSKYMDFLYASEDGGVMITDKDLEGVRMKSFRYYSFRNNS